MLIVSCLSNRILGQAPSDRNPILNAIWVFPADAKIEMAQVIGGSMSRAAKYYVDVGGRNDEALSVPGKIGFKAGEVSYDLQMDPGKTERLTFLIASGGASPPVWEQTAWTPATLRRAADDVWSSWFATGRRIALPDAKAAAQVRAALGEIMMCRGQADDYYVALPRPGGLDGFSFAASRRIVRALDVAGFTREAERMLRIHWQQPAPKPLAFLAQSRDGQWTDRKGTACPQAQALLALAEHALLTKDKDWTTRAYPAVKAGAGYLKALRAQGKAPAGSDAAWCAQALRAAADTAQMLGNADDAKWMRAEADALGTTAPDEAGAYTNCGPCVDAANTVLRLLTRAK